MSEEYESIMQGLKEAVLDSKGNNSLPIETIEYSNTNNSQEAPKGIVPISYDLSNDKERNKE